MNLRFDCGQAFTVLRYPTGTMSARKFYMPAIQASPTVPGPAFAPTAGLTAANTDSTGWTSGVILSSMIFASASESACRVAIRTGDFPAHFSTRSEEHTSELQSPVHL